MANLPSGRADQLSWLEARIDQWISKASDLNIDAADATALKAKITAARLKFNSAEVARAEAKGATQVWYEASDDMLRPARAIIQQIKAYAEATDNVEGVFGIALMDPPQPPQPAVAPATPENIRGSVDTSGILTLAWDATPSGPSSGIIFQVSKQMQGATTWTLVGATYDKDYIDPQFVACDGNVSYRVQARRGDLFSGFAGPLQVNFGSPGASVQTFTSTPQSKAA